MILHTLLSKQMLMCISALDIAFGSLYKDDVLIQPTRVVSVLAAATLLGLVSINIIRWFGNKSSTCLCMSMNALN